RAASPRSSWTSRTTAPRCSDSNSPARSISPRCRGSWSSAAGTSATNSRKWGGSTRPTRSSWVPPTGSWGGCSGLSRGGWRSGRSGPSSSFREPRGGPPRGVAPRGGPFPCVRPRGWVGAGRAEPRAPEGRGRCPRGPCPGGLLDRDRLGQVAGLVDVAAEGQRRVVGEELQRDAHEDGVQLVLVLRHHDRVVGLLLLLVGHREDLAAAGLDLLHGGAVLLQQVVVRHDRDRGQRRLDQGERAVLELGGGVGLGVDVRDLLQLQG